MPFRSTAQQRFAFATGQPWAQRWADETDFSSLPARAKRKGRKWGKRTKAAVAIATKPMTRSEAARVAALARWGKYTPKPKPVAAAPRRSRSGRARAARGGGGGRDPQRERERQQDRETRLTRQQQRDTERAQDRTARQARQEQRDRERAAAAAQRQAERMRKEIERQNKPKGGGGGGGKGKKEDPAKQQRQAEAARRRQETDRRRRAAEQRRQQREAERAEQKQRELTDLAQRMEAGARLSDTELQKLIVNGLAERRGNEVMMTTAGRAQARRKPKTTDDRRPTTKGASLAVFKDASGRHRWITRTTTAYRDRDAEIISTKALEDDAARMTATKQYGPLRWWHVGQPDPFNPAAPWGPGVDIGDCDFSIVVGRTSVESGTFRDPALAELVAGKAAGLEVSPGFFHSEREPDQQRVFWKIRRFERSLVPVRYGRASNLFTGLTVQEKTMQGIHIRYKALDGATIDQRLLALKELGASDETIAKLAADIQQSDKAAAQQGIAFKSDDAPAVYLAPNGTPGVIHDGRFVALKAALPMAEETAEVETQADAPTMDEPPADEGGPFVGDMTPDEFKALLSEAIAPLVGALNIETKMRGLFDEFKGSMGGALVTKKEADERTAEITSLKEQQTQLAARLAELEGDQPAVTTNPDVEAALKSGGPQSPEAQQSQVPPGVNPAWAGIFERVATGAAGLGQAAPLFGQPPQS